MILEKKLMPTYMAAHFYDVTPDFCRAHGIRALICDIDNTLATYDDAIMPANVEEWLDRLADEGVSVAFVSNNTPERVRTFVGERNIPAFPDAHKPSRKYFDSALAALGCDRSAAAVLGDQLLTDSLAAHRAELVSIIVPPIRDRTGAFFRFKRAVERPYIKKFLRSPDAPALSGTVWHKNHDTGKTETEDS